MSSGPDSIDGPDDTTGDEAFRHDVSGEERTWGVVVHAVAFIGFFIPLGNILGPLVVWAIKKDEGPFVDENGKQAVNFQITWTLLLIGAALSILLLVGLVLFPVLMIAYFILIIIAIIQASNDQVYEYPLTLDLVS
ncbi:DUF4870 domain-containing protein [Natranaeroarchaeum aerophilus]|uniref:DUF4870 domain-containing protein n=1 Tax=Natranaeroarchaeum aerophilus TaxID=2917711 RepID=A0AAE3K7I9_9EURY|nr:DUF4870 domain-containing protein [Natranaeroarchaeum aerophilus]MCL9813959.1 DUF4870 domain-containing protein [Natranaeroarchaeum aerophilus]